MQNERQSCRIKSRHAVQVDLPQLPVSAVNTAWPPYLALMVCHFFSDFIVGTVHKAKGLEFDTVMVTDDFIKLPDSRNNLHNFSFGLFLWINLFLVLHYEILDCIYL